MDNLVDIDMLKQLLGYTDKRSVKVWCKKHNVPLHRLGKRTYTLSHCLESVLESKLLLDKATNLPSEQSQDGLRFNSKSTAGNKPDSTTSSPKRKEIRRNKNIHSRAASTLLNNIYSSD